MAHCWSHSSALGLEPLISKQPPPMRLSQVRHVCLGPKSQYQVPLLLELGGGDCEDDDCEDDDNEEDDCDGDGSSQEETICATPALTNSMQVESENCEQAPEFCLQNTVPSLLLLELGGGGSSCEEDDDGGGGSSQEETICATPALTNSMQVESES